MTVHIHGMPDRNDPRAPSWHDYAADLDPDSLAGLAADLSDILAGTREALAIVESRIARDLKERGASLWPTDSVTVKATPVEGAYCGDAVGVRVLFHNAGLRESDIADLVYFEEPKPPPGRWVVNTTKAKARAKALGLEAEFGALWSKPDTGAVRLSYTRRQPVEACE